MIIYFPLGKWDTQKGEMVEIKKNRKNGHWKRKSME